MSGRPALTFEEVGFLEVLSSFSEELSFISASVSLTISLVVVIVLLFSSGLAVLLLLSSGFFTQDEISAQAKAQRRRVAMSFFIVNHSS